MEDEYFIAKYVVGRLGTSDLVEFADVKLSSGIYSDYFLKILDEELKCWPPISEYFEASLIDLGYKLPSYEEAILFLVQYHITLIGKGSVSPSRQFGLMLQDIDSFSLHKGIKKYVGDNIGIEKMYGWYHEDYCSIEETDRGIFEESLIWLAENCEKH